MVRSTLGKLHRPKPNRWTKTSLGSLEAYLTLVDWCMNTPNLGILYADDTWYFQAVMVQMKLYPELLRWADTSNLPELPYRFTRG